MNIENTVARFSSSRRELVAATGAERRASIDLITKTIDALRPIIIDLCERIVTWKRDYAGHHESRVEHHDLPGWLVWESHESGGTGYAHVWFDEIWIMPDGTMRFGQGQEWWGLVASDGEEVGGCDRALSHVGVREVARRIGGQEFVRSVMERLEKVIISNTTKCHESKAVCASLANAVQALG